MGQFICSITVKKRGFLILVYNLVMLHLDFTNYDVWMADYIINLWIFLSNVLDFKCNSLLSVKPDVTFAQGIMVLWNITNTLSENIRFDLLKWKNLPIGSKCFPLRANSIQEGTWCVGKQT